MRSRVIQSGQQKTPRWNRPAPFWVLAGLVALQMVFGAGTKAAETTSQSAEAVPASQPQARYRKAAIVPIVDEINDVTLESLKRRIAEAQKDGADLLVFEMNTPGGQVISALKICKLIKGIPQHTVAWVNAEAYSAGAIISLACNEIVMARRSTIGDAMPITIGTEGPRAVSEDIKPKVTGPLLEEIRDSARRCGYSVLLCESMIMPTRDVFWIQNTKAGEKRFVTWGERDRLFGITSTQPGVSTSQPIDAGSKTDWQYVTSVPLMPDVKQPVVPSGELLTMSQNEAISYGFAKPTMISNAGELQQYYNVAAEPQRLETNWSEDLVSWLTSPIIRGALLMIALLAGYVELNHPGVILPGVVAVLCLALFLGAPYLSGLASIWAILMVVVGLALLLVEIFVIPSFGIVGIVGAVMLLVGLVASFVPAEWPGQSPLHLPNSEYAWTALRNGMMAVVVALAGAIAGMVILSRHFQRMPYLNRLVAANPQASEISLEDWFADLPRPGEIGVTIGPLHPAGKARFAGKPADVVAESDFIEAGQQVQVSERVGNRVVVRQVARNE